MAAAELQRYYKAQHINILACGLRELGDSYAEGSLNCEEIAKTPSKLSLLVKKLGLKAGDSATSAGTVIGFFAGFSMVPALAQLSPLLSDTTIAISAFISVLVVYYLTAMKVAKAIDRLPETSQQKHDFVLALQALGISDPKNFHIELAKKLTASSFDSCDNLLNIRIHDQLKALPR